MLIADLFSHKIHSSGEDWPSKLIDIATIFNEFHGKPYDRSAIESRLSEISPRASQVARDPSKFRDEISAYPAYLGLYRIELVGGVWHVFLSPTAKAFLVSEEPNAPAFMLLQLILFQYPNGMGVAYRGNSDSVRIQSNARDRTLNFIQHEVHLSPFRLICKAIKADSLLNNTSPIDSTVALDEIFVLANTPEIYQDISPDVELVASVLKSYRAGHLAKPDSYESRFHILKHTNFLVSDREGVRLREPLNSEDAKELIKKLDTINSISQCFEDFDSAESGEDLLEEVKLCSWGRYFDGITTLNSSDVSTLTEDSEEIYQRLEDGADQSYQTYEIRKTATVYPFKEYQPVDSKGNSKKGKKAVVYTDPEVTKIRRQRANLIHKIVLDKLHNYLDSKGAQSFENEHIDLYSELPSNDRFVFEVKSTNERNLLSQTRKGVSQLYEYRYRYQGEIGYDTNLILVFPEEPKAISWLQEYLCSDRNIGVVWFEDDDLIYSACCEDIVSGLTA